MFRLYNIHSKHICSDERKHAKAIIEKYIYVWNEYYKECDVKFSDRQAYSDYFFSGDCAKDFLLPSIYSHDICSGHDLSWKIYRYRSTMSAWKTGIMGVHTLSFGQFYMEENRKADCYSGRLMDENKIEKGKSRRLGNQESA